MNEELKSYAQSYLKHNLILCTEGEQLVFKRMYAKGNLDLTINEVVDNMEVDKLDWTMQQVQRTILKKGD